MKVTRRKGESYQKLINRFRYKVRNENILQEYMERQFYQSTAEKRKHKRRQLQQHMKGKNDN